MRQAGPFERGDLIWIEMGEPAGHEQGGRRPALVISPLNYNSRSSLAVVCPVTSSARPWPFKVELPDDAAVRGHVIVDQIRAIDPAARYAKFAGTLDADTMEAVTEKLMILTGLITD